MKTIYIDLGQEHLFEKT